MTRCDAFRRTFAAYNYCCCIFHVIYVRMAALAATTHSWCLNSNKSNNKNSPIHLYVCAEFGSPNPCTSISTHSLIRSFVRQCRRPASAKLFRIAYATAWHTHYVISITAGICTNVLHIVRWSLHLPSLVLLCAFRRFNICLRSSPMPAPVSVSVCVCVV